MGDIISALQDTPVPGILVAGGILFLFLAIVGSIKPLTSRPISTTAQRWSGGTGAVLLIMGVVLYVVPVQQPAPGISPVTMAAPVAGMTADLATITLTDTSTPTEKTIEAPTDTPKPEPKAKITNVANGALVTQSIDLIGEYRADVTDDIWVFVHDPGGTFFAASMDPCHGQSTPKAKGKWEIYFGVGVEGIGGDYELVVTIAPRDASDFIADTLMQQCVRGDFQGFANLPPGIEEVQRIEVKRQPVTGPEDTYPAPPAIPDAGLPGQVSVAAFGSNGQVEIEEFPSGTVSGTTDRVWALVYTYYGRWYPQSFDACIGDHTRQSEGEWDARAIFGGTSPDDTGKPYYLVIVLANADADSSLAAQQEDFCIAGKYPGFLTIQLPEGLSERYSTRVIRK